MRAKRKLIKFSTLVALFDKEQEGVPYSRMIRDLDLDVSTPHLTKLLNYLFLSTSEPAIEQSLRPPWLDEDGPEVQEEPDDYKYIGRFPFGVWAKR